MSIVGTRPPLISETNLYEPHHKVTILLIFAMNSLKNFNEKILKVSKYILIY